jgi:hypothetical protein
MWQLPGASGRRRRRPLAALALLVAVAATGLVLLHASRGGAPGYRVEMRPAGALSPAACRAEAHALRMAFPRDPCRPPTARPWFRIVVRNLHDGNGYPVCTATALNARGDPLFRRNVPIGLVGAEPSGPPVTRGTTLRLTWYFDAAASDPSYTRDAPWTTADIRTYSATCHGRPQSQVPI